MNFNYAVSESAMMFASAEENLEEKKKFVKNFGILLSQTRAGVHDAYLDDDDIVHVRYYSGAETLINVHADSYMAIIRDLSQRL